MQQAQETNFETALRDVLRVSKDDLRAMLEAEKRAKIGQPKRGPKPKKPLSVA